MARRRLRVYHESEALALIDEAKLQRSYGEIEGGSVKLMNYLRQSVLEGDATIRGTLECVGVDGEIDYYHDGDVEFIIEEECEKHPNHWVRAVPREKCIVCGEERMAKQK